MSFLLSRLSLLPGIFPCPSDLDPTVDECPHQILSEDGPWPLGIPGTLRHLVGGVTCHLRGSGTLHLELTSGRVSLFPFEGQGRSSHGSTTSRPRVSIIPCRDDCLDCVSSVNYKTPSYSSQ